MNYKKLVNKTNKIKSHELNCQNFMIVRAIDGEDLLVERTTFLCFEKLRTYLKQRNITIGLYSAYRSMIRQTLLYERFVLEKGKEYADQIVAPTGASEHHTGLAIDISVEGINGNCSLENEEKIWEEIHEQLPKFGFILRYPKEKEKITGYPYEPWHIRYIGKKLAIYLTKHNLTLEEYYLKRRKKHDKEY